MAERQTTNVVLFSEKSEAGIGGSVVIRRNFSDNVTQTDILRLNEKEANSKVMAAQIAVLWFGAELILFVLIYYLARMVSTKLDRT